MENRRRKKKRRTLRDIHRPEKGAVPLEKTGENDLRKWMHYRNWYTVKLHGNKFQKGLPDLLCIHPVYGTIFIECKSYRKGHGLSDVQIKTFGEMSAKGGKIWVLRSSEDAHLLDKDPNWHHYITGVW